MNLEQGKIYHIVFNNKELSRGLSTFEYLGLNNNGNFLFQNVGNSSSIPHVCVFSPHQLEESTITPYIAPEFSQTNIQLSPQAIRLQEDSNAIKRLLSSGEFIETDFIQPKRNPTEATKVYRVEGFDLNSDPILREVDKQQMAFKGERFILPKRIFFTGIQFKKVSLDLPVSAKIKPVL